MIKNFTFKTDLVRTCGAQTVKTDEKATEIAMSNSLISVVALEND